MTREVSILLVITSTEAELETPPPRGTEPTTTALKLGIKSGAWKLATTPCNERYQNKLQYPLFYASSAIRNC